MHTASQSLVMRVFTVGNIGLVLAALFGQPSSIFERYLTNHQAFQNDSCFTRKTTQNAVISCQFQSSELRIPFFETNIDLY